MEFIAAAVHSIHGLLKLGYPEYIAASVGVTLFGSLLAGCIARRLTKTRRHFLYACIFTVVAAHVLLVGNVLLDLGLRNIKEGMIVVNSHISTTRAAGNRIGNLASQVQTAVQSASCSVDLSSYFGGDIDQIAALNSTINNVLTNAHGKIVAAQTGVGAAKVSFPIFSLSPLHSPMHPLFLVAIAWSGKAQCSHRLSRNAQHPHSDH